MNSLNNDELFTFAIHLELPELLKFCATSKKIDKTICRKDTIWNYKLDQEFPKWKAEKRFVNSVKGKSLKEIYTLLYRLTILKEKLNGIRLSIYELYTEKAINLTGQGFEELPTELGLLDNLEILIAERNRLKELPQEIWKLKNLRHLNVSHNKLENIPAEIQNLKNLRRLNVSYNPLTTLPKEIARLVSLEILVLNDTKITNLPKEIMQDMWTLDDIRVDYELKQKLPRHLKALADRNINY
jgi:Leucine-rich repeat (LRR) protein